MEVEWADLCQPTQHLPVTVPETHCTCSALQHLQRTEGRPATDRAGRRLVRRHGDGQGRRSRPDGRRAQWRRHETRPRALRRLHRADRARGDAARLRRVALAARATTRPQETRQTPAGRRQQGVARDIRQGRHADLLQRNVDAVGYGSSERVSGVRLYRSCGVVASMVQRL